MWPQLALAFCFLVSLNASNALFESLAVWLLIQSVYHLYVTLKRVRKDSDGPRRQ